MNTQTRLPVKAETARMPAADVGRAASVPTRAKSYIIAGALFVALLVGAVGGWTAFAKVASAIIAPGTVVVKSNSKKVQHLDGGIVSRIFVKNGDRVKAGDVVIRLDDTETKSRLEILRRQSVEMRARAARFKAERLNSSTLEFDDALITIARKNGMEEALDGQRSLLQRRIASTQNRSRQLDQRILQYREQIVGLKAQRDSLDEQLGFIDDELKDARTLREKGLMRKTRLLELQRSRARLAGERGKLVSQIASTGVQISEAEEKQLQLTSDLAREAEKELRDAQAKIDELDQNILQASKKLERVAVKAPTGGIVDKLAVYTEGGVVGSGEPVMFIVPDEEQLIIEARISGNDIDEVRKGQNVAVRLGSFDADETPELAGRVTFVSADVTAAPDGSTAPYYTARVELDRKELGKLNGQTLVPGMPAEVFFRTGERTVLAFLLKPFKDQIARTFR